MNNQTDKNTSAFGEMRLFGIRGAARAENTKESITEATVELCQKIFSENSLRASDVVSVIFSMTNDLTACNPASAFRHGCAPQIDTKNIPLFAVQEVNIDNAPTHMIRVLVTAYMSAKSAPHHVYIRGAEKLRPDISS